MLYACLLLAALTAATPPPSERVIAPDGKATLSVNGIPRTVLIDPAALGIPIITKDYAQAAGMKPGMIEVGFTVGPVKLEGKTAVAEIQAGTGAAYKRRIAFAERPLRERLRRRVRSGQPARSGRPLSPARSAGGERVTSLPMVGGGGLFGDWGSRYVVIPIEGEPMRVIFNPRKAYSSTNAGGAVRLARAYQGQLTGATTLGEVAFGVERPLRTWPCRRRSRSARSP